MDTSEIFGKLGTIYAAYIDPIEFSNSIYCYCSPFTIQNWYVNIEGQEFNCGMSAESVNLAGYKEDYNPDWLMKGLYSINDSKGSTTYYYGKPHHSEYKPYDLAKYSENFKNDTILSVNGKYKASSNKFGTVKVNGVKTELISGQNFDDNWDQLIAIQNNGDCIVEIFQRSMPPRVFIVKNGKKSELPENQFYNYRTGAIDDLENADKGFFRESYYARGLTRVLGMVRMLQDATKNHSIEACGLYDYVLIDNIRYGKSTALGIWYNKELNSFYWTALEGKELVMYQYKL